jgi:hypothetical protein
MKQINRVLTRHNLLLPGYLVLSSFIIMLPALFNGYPLFYSDSALYIKAAMLFGNVPKGDSIPCLSGLGYSFFIRIVTWKTTLYLVILAQALILNVLIYLSLKELFAGKKALLYHFPIIILLSICSSMGWTAGQLMPDIFTSYLVLSVFLFFSWNKKSRGIYLFLSVIIICSILSHLSNISISVLILALLFLLFLFKRSFRIYFRLFLGKCLIMLALLFASLLILIGLNNKYYNYSGLSPTSHIFFMARLIDTGFMQEFLTENCDEKSYEMCQYKDNLPNSYQSFLWSPESVFYKTGGWDLSKHEEYKKITRDVLTSPRYLVRFLYNCVIHSYDQSVTFKIGDGLTTQYNKESPPYQEAVRYFNHREFTNNFQASKQIQGTLNFGLINIINYILIFISILIILWTLIYHKIDGSMYLFTYIIICGVIVNAVATSSLASIFDRFQSRIIWLIPLLASVCFFTFLYPPIKNRLIKLLNANIESTQKSRFP